MLTTDLIGVPFDGFGRPGSQAGAAAAFSGHEVMAEPDFVLPEPNPERAANSGLIDEEALLTMTDER